MNRLPVTKASTFTLSLPSHFSLSAPPSSTTSFPQFDRQVGERKSSSHYALFAPLHYERGYSYPLLVWLHSEGGSERELRRVMPHVSMRNYVAAAARGGVKSRTAGGSSYTWRQSANSACDAAERVRQCIDVAQKRFNVHAERIFIAGYGSGGTMALRLALTYPEWFAGAASLGGAMPEGNCPLRRVKKARSMPLLLASTRESIEYPQSSVVGDLRLLHSAGFSLSLRQYPGGDDLTTGMLADMDRWIMDQISFSGAAVQG
jgi:phospholipase/carboxylesterase